jgi:hypothetical protein
MPPSEIWRRVAVERNDVSEELIASLMKVNTSSELVTTLTLSLVFAGVVSISLILSNVMVEAIHTSETSHCVTSQKRAFFMFR